MGNIGDRKEVEKRKGKNYHTWEKNNDKPSKRKRINETDTRKSKC